jgi:phospholipase A1/A2
MRRLLIPITFLAATPAAAQSLRAVPAQPASEDRNHRGRRHPAGA